MQIAASTCQIPLPTVPALHSPLSPYSLSTPAPSLLFPVQQGSNGLLVDSPQTCAQKLSLSHTQKKKNNRQLKGEKSSFFCLFKRRAEYLWALTVRVGVYQPRYSSSLLTGLSCQPEIFSSPLFFAQHAHYTILKHTTDQNKSK